MGKTKTAFIAAEGSKDTTTGAEKYKLKKAKQAAQEVKKESGGKESSDTTVFVEESAKQKAKTRGIRSKNYLAVKAKIDKNKLYTVADAIKLVKETSLSSFDATMEVHLVVKKKGLSVNVTLPYQSGKTKVIEVANEETIKKLTTGRIDFDTLLATPEMMPKLVPFARLLGPKGLMPNPRNGTLIKKAEDAKRFSTSSMTIKTEKDFPLIHSVVGKLSLDDTKLQENIEALFTALNKKLIEKAYLKATMSPSVKLQI